MQRLPGPQGIQSPCVLPREEVIDDQPRYCQWL